SVSCLLHLQVTLNIPRQIEKPILFFVLLYRRLRYGCAFRRIPLTQGKFAIVDPDDYSWLSRSKWFATKNGSTFYAKRNTYVRENARTRSVCMHRQIINVPDGLVIDHINFNGLDNRKVNLRLATRTQNNRHTRRTIHPGASKYKGVCWYKREKRWAVRITADGKTIPIGYFKDEIEAAKAYDHAAKKYHGDFAALNFTD
ncbi:MAG: AP2 domain-containing protein, partial [Sedimentisphaerales bacterium]|nr:AP2 domain-containing protein [Sedimentisphaerales bacterium]